MVGLSVTISKFQSLNRGVETGRDPTDCIRFRQFPETDTAVDSSSKLPT